MGAGTETTGSACGGPSLSVLSSFNYTDDCASASGAHQLHAACIKGMSAVPCSSAGRAPRQGMAVPWAADPTCVVLPTQYRSCWDWKVDTSGNGELLSFL